MKRSRRDTVRNVRVSVEFIEKMDKHIDSTNAAAPFGLTLDRSKLIRTATAEHIDRAKAKEETDVGQR